jgi:hypothetical protein
VGEHRSANLAPPFASTRRSVSAVAAEPLRHRPGRLVTDAGRPTSVLTRALIRTQTAAMTMCSVGGPRAETADQRVHPARSIRTPADNRISNASFSGDLFETPEAMRSRAVSSKPRRRRWVLPALLRRETPAHIPRTSERRSNIAVGHSRRSEAISAGFIRGSSPLTTTYFRSVLTSLGSSGSHCRVLHVGFTCGLAARNRHGYREHEGRTRRCLRVGDRL